MKSNTTKSQNFIVLIAEPDRILRQKLKTIFSNIVNTMPGAKFNIIECDSPEEIEKTFKGKQPDMVFMDSEYLLEKTGRIVQMFKSVKTKYQLIMLISDNGRARIREVIRNLENDRPLLLGGHILKENFSQELMTILIRFFIRKSRK